MVSKGDPSIEITKKQWLLSLPGEEPGIDYKHKTQIKSLLIGGEIRTSKNGVAEFSLLEFIRSYNFVFNTGGGFASEGLFNDDQSVYYFTGNLPIITSSAKLSEPVITTNKVVKNDIQNTNIGGVGRLQIFDPVIKIYTWDVNGDPKGNVLVNWFCKSETIVDILIN